MLRTGIFVFGFTTLFQLCIKGWGTRSIVIRDFATKTKNVSNPTKFRSWCRILKVYGKSLWISMEACGWSWKSFMKILCVRITTKVIFNFCTWCIYAKLKPCILLYGLSVWSTYICNCLVNSSHEDRVTRLSVLCIWCICHFHDIYL